MNFEPKENTILTERTARFFSSAEFTPQVKTCWIVLHGYAQHPAYFLRKFSPFFNEQTVFIAPEGLSRFYASGSNGKVVASWMTKESRLTEINDYVNYLDKVASTIPSGIELSILGFSQGTATMARWISLGKLTPINAVFYASVFPPDIVPDFSNGKWKTVNVEVIMGLHDPFHQPSEIRQSFEPHSKAYKNLNFTEFNGAHEINEEVLRHVFEKK